MRCCAAALAMLSWTLPIAAQDIEKFDGRSTKGWSVLGLDGRPIQGPTLTVADNAVVFRYKREVLAPLIYSAPLQDLVEIRLTLSSQTAIPLLLGLEDRDKAKFHHIINVPAGKKIQVQIRPKDWKLGADSPVKKAALDPKRLGLGFAFLDLGVLTGAKGENTLRIYALEIEREGMSLTDLPRQVGDLIVEQPLTISESALREGNLVVKKGARLTITAPVFALRGNLLVQGGSVEIDGGHFRMPQRFNGEFRIDLDKNSTLLIRKARFHTEFPLGLNLNTSSVTVDQVDFRGGITTTPTGKCRMTVSKANAIGEFIVAPDFDLSCTDSDDLFFWMALGFNFQGKLTLPAGKVVTDWSSGHHLNLRLKNCNKVHWCILSTERGKGSVEGTDLYGCGLLFGGQSRVALKELHNKRPLENFTLGVTDRNLRFKHSTVASWTFYVNEKAHLTVDRSTFGEALAFGNGKIVIRDSTCDGTGGFIGAVQDSEIRMTNCTITCLVLAKGNATIILQNCKVSGDVRATDYGTVRLMGCEVKGNVSKDPGATLIRD